MAAVEGTFNDTRFFVGTCGNVALDFNAVHQGYPDFCWQWAANLFPVGWFAERAYINRNNGTPNRLYFA